MLITPLALIIHHPHSLTLLVFFSAIVMFISGIIYPTGMGKSMIFFREFAGTAGAFTTTIITLITGLSGLMMSFVGTATATPIYIIYLALSILCWACYQLLICKNNRLS